MGHVNVKTDSVPELNHVMDRDINLLSGGELQRFAIGTVCVQQADVYGSLSLSSNLRADGIQLYVRRALFLS
jgi:translation initiation factor RLI1